MCTVVINIYYHLNRQNYKQSFKEDLIGFKASNHKNHTHKIKFLTFSCLSWDLKSGPFSPESIASDPSHLFTNHEFLTTSCQGPRPVWTSFKIAVRHKLLTHNKNRLYFTYKKAIVNSIALGCVDKFEVEILKNEKTRALDGWMDGRMVEPG